MQAKKPGRICQRPGLSPIRQEQLKERLGDRFRELDTPLLVEWLDGRREAWPIIVWIWRN
ncbi:MAG: hypothetical protein AB7S77_09895 [Desulfatirhabdiaceae bacterium]